MTTTTLDPKTIDKNACCGRWRCNPVVMTKLTGFGRGGEGQGAAGGGGPQPGACCRFFFRTTNIVVPALMLSTLSPPTPPP